MHVFVETFHTVVFLGGGGVGWVEDAENLTQLCEQHDCRCQYECVYSATVDVNMGRCNAWDEWYI